MRPLIITRPERQSTAQRWGFGLLTVLFWGLFGYFIRPLLTMAAWSIGYWRFHDVMIEGHGFNHLLRLLAIYGIIIASISLSLIGWSIYNLIRYGYHEKRKTSPPPVTPEMLAEYFEIDPEDVRIWQDTDRLVLDFDSSGRIVEPAQSSPGLQGSSDSDVDSKDETEPSVS
jgi:poly-beta-1,6-N-acetyl-D-glucosamine biosynthesis protein PgaD